MKLSVNQFKCHERYYKTIASIRIDNFTEYWLDRFSIGHYRVICHMSGCGNDYICEGSLGKCYKKLKQLVA